MGDYHRARWQALQNLFVECNVYAADLGTNDGFYGWQNTLAHSQYRLLSLKPVSKRDFTIRLVNFIKLIRQNNIRYVCIPGYGRPEYIAMLIISKLLGRKILMFAESWYPGNRIFDFIKGILLRIFVNVFLVSGLRARDHFHHRLGIPLNRIATGYSVVDNKHFANPSPATDLPSPPQAESGRTIHNSLTLLCIARFVPEKNLIMLIETFYKSGLYEKQWNLKIAGGGPLKDKLLGIILDNHVELIDWISYDQLPGLYHAADCFILPSIFEPWGLVVNEAMAAALPVIVSEQCGCCPDLLDETNGWVFDATNQESLVSILNKLSETNDNELRLKGNCSIKIISDYSPETWAENVKTLFQFN